MLEKRVRLHNRLRDLSMKWVGTWMLFISLTWACQEPVTETVFISEIRNDLTDSIVRKILDFQHAGNTDSLLQYTSHPDPTYRYYMAQAFASHQDNRALDSLHYLLNDTIYDVAQQAAYAVGQIGSSRSTASLTNAFASRQYQVNTPFQATLLEAVGKTGDETTLDLITAISTYDSTDDQLLYGQCLAIYRLMLEGHVSNTGTKKMIEILGNGTLTDQVKTYASNYLARVSSNQLSTVGDQLTPLVDEISNSQIRINLLIAIGKAQSQGGQTKLIELLQQSDDQQTRMAAITALGYYPYRDIRSTIHRSLNDRNQQIANKAASIMLNNGSSTYWRQYMDISLRDYPALIKIQLLGVANKYIPIGDQLFKQLNNDYIRQRLNSSNKQVRIEAIKSLSWNPYTAQTIINIWNQSSDVLIKNACLEGLQNIVQHQRFDRLNVNTRRAVLNALIEAIESKDVGQIYLAAQILGQTSANDSEYNLNMLSRLERVNSELEIPEDVEAIIALNALLTDMGGNERSYNLNHQTIDWKLLDKYAQRTQVVVNTSEGNFTMRLAPDIAPGTVANFLRLVEESYFDNKNFHRVVPNFVIQGGCGRGDGFGSLDYAIRSEVPQIYYDLPGQVGMASAGLHTESAQWFVTSVPTPHLDGRYTIFATITDGLSVVREITAGTTITSIEVM